MRLIDAKGLFDKVGKIKPRSKEHYKSIGEFMNLITNSPTIDAVEVVRCGECRHMMADGRCKEFADDGIRPSATDFCSYGERREDGEA